MSARDGFENDLMKHIFQNATIPNIGDAVGLRGSSAAGSFWFAIHTSSPDDSASGTECNYTGYARVEVPRTASGFTVTGNNLSNASGVTFGQCVSGTNSAVAFTVNTASGLNVDDAIIWGALQSTMSIIAGVTPNFAIGDLNINVD